VLVQDIEHALDAGFHDLVGVLLVDVVVEDALVDLAQQLEVVVEFPASGGRILGFLPGGERIIRGPNQRGRHEAEQAESQQNAPGDSRSGSDLPFLRHFLSFFGGGKSRWGSFLFRS